MGLTSTVSASHDSEDCPECTTDDSDDKHKKDGGFVPDADGRTCSLKCGQDPPDFHDGDSEPWYDSSITFHNCGDCHNPIEVQVTGEIGPNKDDHSEMGSLSHVSDKLAPDERVTYWFTGCVHDLTMGFGDTNVAISQRARHLGDQGECNT